MTILHRTHDEYAVVILQNLNRIISGVVMDMSRDGHVYMHKSFCTNITYS